jgi:hypothetical protein
MAKSKKQKTTSCQPQMGAYKRFLIDMYDALRQIHITSGFSELSNEFKRTAYDYRIGIWNPTAGNGAITTSELKMFSERAKKDFRTKTFLAEDRFLSAYQLQLIYAFFSARTRELEKEKGDKNHPTVIEFQNATNNLLKVFFTRFALPYFKMISSLSNPDQKYFGTHIRLAPFYKENPRMEFMCDIYGFPAQKFMISINGQKRPTFRLAKPILSAKTPIIWLTADVSLLGKSYFGNKKTLDVYIQSHALSRLKERLDLLDQEAINYALWENTNDIKEFVTYHGYLLLPFKVFGIKTGYLVASVTDDKLLFRTFLFITHNSSPEGDRLRKLSGLGKEDIRYWKIDRLSTFVNLDVEKYPGLIQLFRKAGLETLFDLRNKEFTSDLMQTANLDGLLEYIDRGKCECKLMNLSLDTLVSELELSGLK